MWKVCSFITPRKVRTQGRTDRITRSMFNFSPSTLQPHFPANKETTTLADPIKAVLNAAGGTYPTHSFSKLKKKLNGFRFPAQWWSVLYTRFLIKVALLSFYSRKMWIFAIFMRYGLRGGGIYPKCPLGSPNELLNARNAKLIKWNRLPCWKIKANKTYGAATWHSSRGLVDRTTTEQCRQVLSVNLELLVGRDKKLSVSGAWTWPSTSSFISDSCESVTAGRPTSREINHEFMFVLGGALAHHADHRVFFFVWCTYWPILCSIEYHLQNIAHPFRVQLTKDKYL